MNVCDSIMLKCLQCFYYYYYFLIYSYFYFYLVLNFLFFVWNITGRNTQTSTSIGRNS